MATRNDLMDWVEEALRSLGGSARIVAVAKQIAKVHGTELERSGDLNFTWHYDMRWAALKLSKAKRIVLSNVAGKGRWAIVERVQ